MKLDYDPCNVGTENGDPAQVEELHSFGWHDGAVAVLVVALVAAVSAIWSLPWWGG